MKCMCWNLWRGLAAWHLRFIVLNGGRVEGVSGGRHSSLPCRYACVTQWIAFRIVALFCKNVGRLRFGLHEHTFYCWKVGSHWVINRMWPWIGAEWERCMLWETVNAAAKLPYGDDCMTADCSDGSSLWGCLTHRLYVPSLSSPLTYLLHGAESFLRS